MTEALTWQILARIWVILTEDTGLVMDGKCIIAHECDLVLVIYLYRHKLLWFLPQEKSCLSVWRVWPDWAWRLSARVVCSPD